MLLGWEDNTGDQTIQTRDVRSKSQDKELDIVWLSDSSTDDERQQAEADMSLKAFSFSKLIPPFATIPSEEPGALPLPG